MFLQVAQVKCDGVNNKDDNDDDNNTDNRTFMIGSFWLMPNESKRKLGSECGSESLLQIANNSNWRRALNLIAIKELHLSEVWDPT